MGKPRRITLEFDLPDFRKFCDTLRELGLNEIPVSIKTPDIQSKIFTRPYGSQSDETYKIQIPHKDAGKLEKVRYYANRLKDCPWARKVKVKYK